jgi:hypothetical protein
MNTPRHVFVTYIRTTPDKPVPAPEHPLITGF